MSLEVLVLGCDMSTSSDDLFPDSGFSVFLFKIIINTIPFKIPPTFENVVTKLNSSCGTSSITCQIQYKDIGNHWTKKATTNKDIVFAALGDSRNACEDFPKEGFKCLVSWCIRYQLSR
jgi:hypothetical protein